MSAQEQEALGKIDVEINTLMTSEALQQSDHPLNKSSQSRLIELGSQRIAAQTALDAALRSDQEQVHLAEQRQAAQTDRQIFDQLTEARLKPNNSDEVSRLEFVLNITPENKTEREAELTSITLSAPPAETLTSDDVIRRQLANVTGKDERMEKFYRDMLPEE